LHSINPPKQNKNPSGSASHVEEKEEAAAPEDDGWLEVGKKNKSVITRTVSFLSFYYLSSYLLLIENLD